MGTRSPHLGPNTRSHKVESYNNSDNTSTMEKLNMEEMKQNSGASEKGYSFIQLIVGAVMVGVGYQYLPLQYRNWYYNPETMKIDNGDGTFTDIADPKEQDPCPNGSAYWLYVAGILLLVSNFLNGWSKMYKKCAERDGKIDCGEKFSMAVNSASSTIMSIVDFAAMIWGSVVVFGAWATWTDDYAIYAADTDAYNYCEHTPMMTAFVILILKWVMIPCMIVAMCFCGCCMACCCAACAPKENTQAA